MHRAKHLQSSIHIFTPQDVVKMQSVTRSFVSLKYIFNFFYFFQTAIFTVILLPVRVAIICFFLISGWLLACIGLWGLTEEDLRTRPVTGWRR